MPVIGKEPPKVFEQVRPGNVGDLVPPDGPGFVWGKFGCETNSAKLRDLLGIEFDVPLIVPCQPLDLLDDAEFGPVLFVQERRNDSEAQFSPALEPLQLERARRPSGTFAGDRECQSRA